MSRNSFGFSLAVIVVNSAAFFFFFFVPTSAPVYLIEIRVPLEQSLACLIVSTDLSPQHADQLLCGFLNEEQAS
ncbi:unnamed protein product [Haemonchus placei]|uniref:Secreted protein n=1 Tax=Haemonchus placei TaxID=6290 RepID=A0A0N4VYI9_HAEPC|nr:unnamed protein product [Haemonchus placei]